MSTTTEATTTVEPLDTETQTKNLTYTFKTTEENKTEQINPAVNEEVKSNILEFQTRNGRWRSLGQFVNDAIIFYINGNSSDKTVEEIEELFDRDYDYTLSAAITESLHDEVKMLVDHPHTKWNFKQEFYSCAIFAYEQADFPVVERR